MSFFKALTKSVLRAANNYLHKQDIKKAQKESYIQTGEKIKKADRNGYYVNGKKEYNKAYNNKIDKANQKHSIRESFIDDL